MGNYNTRAVRFLQSPFDFPCPVALGKDTPSFGLYRFNQALRFVPLDDEKFTMRGDKQRLVYKGRRRSHRFTILGNTAFEYDCILEREPESNVVSLLMEGAEHFDFFQQPDFVPDPFLKGSYAVYKKETLLGEGTGKLCHIHRPLIIDARGRKCWGDLLIIGNVLRITIPEQWLAEAKYPVVVDPVVGTNTVGSQTIWYDPDNEGYYELFFEFSFGVNRYQISQAFNGTATAFIYVYNTDYWGRCRPVLYSDNNNVPLTKRSTNEGYFDIEVKSGKPAGWRSATFSTNTNLASGTNIWFGVWAEWVALRFDWGAKCYRDWWETNNNDLPNTYPIYSANYFYDWRLSMYFEYSLAQNYVRTLTQGVNLSDTKKLTADYKRSIIQTVEANTVLSRFETFYRKLYEAVNGISNISNTIAFFRSLFETVKVTETFCHWWAFLRGLIDTVEIKTESEAKQGYLFIVQLIETVRVTGIVFRGLLLFVRIITGVFIRDYLLSRFLKARQDIVLNSCISKEITLDSKIG